MTQPARASAAGLDGSGRVRGPPPSALLSSALAAVRLHLPRRAGRNLRETPGVAPLPGLRCKPSGKSRLPCEGAGSVTQPLRGSPAAAAPPQFGPGPLSPFHLRAAAAGRLRLGLETVSAGRKAGRPRLRSPPPVLLAAGRREPARSQPAFSRLPPGAGAPNLLGDILDPGDPAPPGCAEEGVLRGSGLCTPDWHGLNSRSQARGCAPARPRFPRCPPTNHARRTVGVRQAQGTRAPAAPSEPRRTA